MGKTETGKMFARLGIPVCSSDEIVHRIYDVGGAAVSGIAKVFPETVREGRVDREMLAKRVTGDESGFRDLEAIVHPLVRQAQQDFIESAAQRREALVVLDIPLLFETGGEKHVDAVVVVSAPAPVQRARLLARPGMTIEKLEAMHARQIPDVDKRARADFVIETDKGLEHAFESVKHVVAQIHQRGK
jgi:dephospho-CoA kinase